MNGYTDCISLSYSYDGKNLRGNTAEMEKAFNSLYEQAEKQLNGVEFNQYDEILFVSKSIGTDRHCSSICQEVQYRMQNDFLHTTGTDILL